jgi:endonuclease/exonuclease/phosphatase family metal-dependent hydrolase
MARHNYTLTRPICLAAVLSILVGCTTRSEVAPLVSQPPEVEANNKIFIMTYNVENLFDTVDDHQKDDETFLPLEKKSTSAHKRACKQITVEKWRDQCLKWDWSTANLKVKMERLAAVIRSVNGGRGPDLLFLQEVENRKVLEMLRTEYLADLGYEPAILTEGQDKRGIDVAILSKWKSSRYPMLHPVSFKGASKKAQDDTRGILEAQFTTPSGLAVVAYSAHFPAPFHPVDMRKQAFARLNLLAKSQPNKKALIVAGGDFNVPSEEETTTHIIRDLVETDWFVAHKKCKGCKGTNFYPPKNSWSFLDMILVFRNEAFEKSDFASEVVRAIPEQSTADGTPNAFELPGPIGVSDHWPLLMYGEMKAPTK